MRKRNPGRGVEKIASHPQANCVANLAGSVNPIGRSCQGGLDGQVHRALLFQLAGRGAHGEATHPLEARDEEVDPLTSCKTNPRFRPQHKLLHCRRQRGNFDHFSCCCSRISELAGSPLQMTWAVCVTFHCLDSLRSGEKSGKEVNKGRPKQTACARCHHSQLLTLISLLRWGGVIIGTWVTM